MNRLFALSNWDDTVEIDTEIFTEQEAEDCLSFYGRSDDVNNFNGDVRVAAVNLIGEELAYAAPGMIGFDRRETDSDWIWKEYQDHYREGPCFARGVTVIKIETSFGMSIHLVEI